jgi:RNA polymerase sigma-70 factor (ECF subfamily)
MELTHSQRRRLVDLARRILGSTTEAEDVVHDVWLRLHGTRPGAGLVVTAVRNAALDRRRRQLIERRILPAAAPHVSGPGAVDSPAAELEIDRDVRDALAWLVRALAASEVALVLLREVFGAEYEDLARAAGRSPEALRQALHRALARTRAVLDRRRSPALEDDEVRLLAVCRTALASRDAGALYALVRSAPTGCATAPRHACAPRRSRAVAELVQIGGRYALALVQDGVVLCALPVGPEPEDATA